MAFGPFDSAATHLYEPGIRQHVRAALDLGASAAEVMEVLRASGTDHNRWLRQFITYYEMVASLVHRGVLDRDLLEDSVTEYVNLYAKLKPFMKQLRRETGLPTFMRQTERLVEKSLRGQDTLATMEKWFAAARGTGANEDRRDRASSPTSPSSGEN